MEHFKIQTKLFGQLEFTHEHGLYDDFDVILDGNELNIALYIDEGFVDNENLKIIEDLLNHIPIMYKKAKQAIFNEMDSNKVIKFYTECYFEADSIDEVDETNRKLITEKIEPKAIAIDFLDDDKIYCRFDFTLSDTDEILVISFDTRYEICYITHES